ncbi:MAG: acyltransferase [Clostridia bacterium]|nr:acyltransferase [Clostridia bacterium]
MTNESPRSAAVARLKGLAILMVIVAHSRASLPEVNWTMNYLSFSQMAVQLFFVLSGYLVEGSWQRCAPSKKRFYLRRFAAIAPGYWLVLILTALMNRGVRAWTGEVPGLTDGTTPLNWLLNFTFLHGFAPEAFRLYAWGGWYIGTTAILYALHPLFSRGMKRFGGGLPAAALLLSWGVSFALHAAGVEHVWNNNGFWYGFALNQLSCYLLGIRLRNNGGKSLHVTGTGCAFLSVLLTVATAWLMFLSPQPWKYYVMPGVFGYAVYFMLSGRLEREEAADTRLSRLLMRIGDLSYYIFLIHPFIVRVAPKYLLMLPALQGADQNLLLWIFLPFMIVFSCLLAIPVRALCRQGTRLLLKLCGGSDSSRKEGAK